MCGLYISNTKSQIASSNLFLQFEFSHYQNKEYVQLWLDLMA